MSNLTDPASQNGAGQLRNRALDLLKTQALLVILENQESLRTADLARAVSVRLRLELPEEELGGMAQILRLILDGDPLFSQANRQWNLALRMGRAEGDRRKPVERAFMDFLDLLGEPSRAEPISTLAAAVYGREAAYYSTMIERILPSGKNLFSCGDGRLGSTRWLLKIESDDPSDVEWDNFSDPDVVAPARQAASRPGLDGHADPVSLARAIVAGAGRPVDNLALQYVVWQQFPELDPRALFRGLWEAEDVLLERGPAWSSLESHAAVTDEIRAISREPEATVETLLASGIAHETESALAGTGVKVSDEDVNQVYEYVRLEPRSYRLSEICQSALESFPGSRTYDAVYSSLQARLREDSRFAWVGGERFRASGSLPREIEELPEGLTFDTREYGVEEEGEVDRLLDPADWKSHLDQQIMDLRVQDIADDSTHPSDRPVSRASFSPPLHHYVAGTLYLPAAVRRLIPAQPDLLELAILPPSGDRFDVWVNNRTGLIFHFKEWYEANLPWIGGQFHLATTDQPDVLRLEYSGETDPEMDLGLEGLQTLLALRTEAAAEGLTLTEIVTRILKEKPDGISFITLFASVNVVRRSTRGQLASVLSSQRYFVHAGAGAGVWSYDDKRAQKSKSKKKSPPRRFHYSEEDDEEYEI